MPIEIGTKYKNLFLVLATLSLILVMAVTTVLWWFISPRLHEISHWIAIATLTALRIFYFMVMFGIILMLLTSYLEKNLMILRFPVRLATQFLFPVTVLLGRIIGISRDRVRESYVHVNNALTKTMPMKFEPSEILVLLPHCLQNTDCNIRITNDIRLCTGCGKCNIAALKKLAEKYNITIAIATGGTLARRIIVKNRPKFIIAVACQRDLVDGIQDAFPIPVYGILNERPEGPCINTLVAVDKLEHVLENVLK